MFNDNGWVGSTPVILTLEQAEVADKDGYVYTITGLTPGTAYAFRVTPLGEPGGNTPIPGGEITGTFTTLPETPTVGVVHFVGNYFSRDISFTPESGSDSQTTLHFIDKDTLEKNYGGNINVAAIALTVALKAGESLEPTGWVTAPASERLTSGGSWYYDFKREPAGTRQVFYFVCVTTINETLVASKELEVIFPELTSYTGEKSIDWGETGKLEMSWSYGQLPATIYVHYKDATGWKDLSPPDGFTTDSSLSGNMKVIIQASGIQATEYRVVCAIGSPPFFTWYVVDFEENSKIPGQVTGVTSHVSGNTVTLSWTEPEETGKLSDGTATEITGYLVKYVLLAAYNEFSGDDRVPWSDNVTVTGTTAEIVVVPPPKFPPEIYSIYMFSITAINDAGKNGESRLYAVDIEDPSSVLLKQVYSVPADDTTKTIALTDLLLNEGSSATGLSLELEVRGNSITNAAEQGGVQNSSNSWRFDLTSDFPTTIILNNGQFSGNNAVIFFDGTELKVTWDGGPLVGGVVSFLVVVTADNEDRGMCWVGVSFAETVILGPETNKIWEAWDGTDPDYRFTLTAMAANSGSLAIWAWDGLFGVGNDYANITDAYTAFKTEMESGSGSPPPDGWKIVAAERITLNNPGPGSYYYVAVESSGPGNTNKVSPLREVVVGSTPQEVISPILLSENQQLTAAVGVPKSIEWIHSGVTGMSYHVSCENLDTKQAYSIPTSPVTVTLGGIDSTSIPVVGYRFDEPGTYEIRVLASKTVGDVGYRNRSSVIQIVVTPSPVAPSGLASSPVTQAGDQYVTTITFTADNTTGNNPVTTLYYFDTRLWGVPPYPVNFVTARTELLAELRKEQPDLGRIGWTAVDSNEIDTNETTGESSWLFEAPSEAETVIYSFICVTQDINAAVTSDIRVIIPALS